MLNVCPRRTEYCSPVHFAFAEEAANQNKQPADTILGQRIEPLPVAPIVVSRNASLERTHFLYGSRTAGGSGRVGPTFSRAEYVTEIYCISKFMLYIPPNKDPGGRPCTRKRSTLRMLTLVMSRTRPVLPSSRRASMPTSASNPMTGCRRPIARR